MHSMRIKGPLSFAENEILRAKYILTPQSDNCSVWSIAQSSFLWPNVDWSKHIAKIARSFTKYGSKIDFLKIAFTRIS